MRWREACGDFAGSPKYPRILPNVKMSGRTILAKHKELGEMPGKTLADQSLARYRTSGLESSDDELVAIWLKVTSRPSVFKKVAISITNADPIDSAIMARWHLRM